MSKLPIVWHTRRLQDMKARVKHLRITVEELQNREQDLLKSIEFINIQIDAANSEGLAEFDPVTYKAPKSKKG